MRKIGDLTNLPIRVERSVRAEIEKRSDELGVSIAEMSRQLLKKALEKTQ